MKTKEDIMKMSLQELKKRRNELLNQRINTNIRCISCSGCTNCSECFGCTKCSHCSQCSRCLGCSDLLNCRGCTNCSGCTSCSECLNCFCSVNLENKKYMICNVQLTKKEYETKLKELSL